MLRTSTIRLLLAMVLLVGLAGCVPISAMETPHGNVARLPEVLLSGPYEAPANVQAAPESAGMAEIGPSDHLRDLQIEAQRPILSTSDILRGVYGPVEMALPIQ